MNVNLMDLDCAPDEMYVTIHDGATVSAEDLVRTCSLAEKYLSSGSRFKICTRRKNQ